MGLMPDFLDTDMGDEEPKEEIKQLYESDLVFNGVNAETGDYGLPPMPVEEFASKLQGKTYYKVLSSNRDLQKKLIERHSALDRLSRGQWAVLFENLTDERKQLLLEVLSSEQAQIFVKLIKEAGEYHDLRAYSAIVYDILDPQKYEQLLANQTELFEIQIEMLEKELFKGLTREQQQLLEAMLNEQWDFLENELRTGDLDDKAKSPFPVIEGVDPTDLQQSGWAIVFPAAMADKYREAIKQALAPLLTLRQEQAGSLYRVYEGEAGYRPGETKTKFLQRHRVSPGPANPAEMPFYILLVGSPEEIPYEFQYQLDVMRGVGRLDFGDDIASYARYAQNVVLAERGDIKLPKQMAFFGVENPGDKATQLSAKYLLEPIWEDLQHRESQKAGVPLKFNWQFEQFLKKEATKSQLKKLLGADPQKTPALLLTASHGMEFKYDPGDPHKQLAYQGALLCQDWTPGSGSVDRNAYFAGEDLDEEANVLGMIALFFACFGAGTPKFDQFETELFKQKKQIAPHNFIADLPKQLLKRGALAVLGHVERAWGYSFVSPAGFVDNQAFLKAIRHLMNGDPVGWATDPGFDMRYAEMSSDLSSYLQDESQLSNRELVQHWTASNDARGYVVLGDPAVRIPFAKDDETPTERPSLEMPAATAFVAEEKKSTPSAAEEPPVVAAVNFGLRDQVSGLTGSLRKFTDQLADALEKAAADITTLEVKTYTTDDLTAITTQSEGNARLRARTHIDFDGDIKVFVPERAEGGVDQVLWTIHQDMVREAQANRAQFLQAMAEMATNLLKNLT
jgi:hypothetical protein